MTITTPAQMREAAALAVANIEIGYHDGIGGDWHPYNGLHIISAACAAIRALPAAEPEPLAVRVKPLKWVFHDRTGDYKSVYISGGWTISHRGDGCFALHHRDFNEGVDRAYQTPEAAQAAAEADHAARILSQIEAVPVAKVRAEALDVVAALMTLVHRLEGLVDDE